MHIFTHNFYSILGVSNQELEPRTFVQKKDLQQNGGCGRNHHSQSQASPVIVLRIHFVVNEKYGH